MEPARCEPTFCEDCKHLDPDHEKKQPHQVYCMAHKRGEGYGFIYRTVWAKFPPYLYCKDLNSGHCPMFERKDDDAQVHASD